MMFVDQVKLSVQGGTGGNGAVAYRRELKVERGGPFGGNGGKGGSIIFVGDEGLSTLLDLRYSRLIKGNNGENGRNKGMYGACAKNTYVRVPVGTTIYDDDKNMVIGDITKKGDQVIVALGGRGGRGNMAFATNTNKCPDFCEKGEPGEERNLRVELRVLADCGLVGFPSVGKSTIISKISAAKPKIPAYHFTTLKPNLGVVKSNNSSFVVADLPGLIEGASLGEGLGDQFLKHIERTRVIAHVIDMGATEGRDPYTDYVKINKELKEFNPKILEKPQIVIANKMDMPDAEKNLEEFKKKVDNVYPVKAVIGEGLKEVIEKLSEMLDKIAKQPLYEEEKFESHVLYKFVEKEPFTIIKEEDAYVIKGEIVEKLLRMTKFNTDEAATRFASKLRHLGVDDKLKELGAEEGDTIRILDYEFEYTE